MNTEIQPPLAPKEAKRLAIHGDERVDDYYWMRDRTNPATIRYLEEENRYTDAVMRSTTPLQEKIYNEILGRIQQTDLSVPVKDGEYFYFSRTEEGKQYPIWSRKRESLDGEEEILLDGNVLAEGKEYFALGGFAVSDDHRLLAYSMDNDGGER